MDTRAVSIRTVETRSMIRGILVCWCVLSLGACAWVQEQTGAGETTTVSAATGGAIGAGLGAIVGSQTGDAGAGLVIGGLAGTAAGAAIGNVLEGQEEAIQTQEEAIERQERVIRAQSEELQELRRGRTDLAGADVRGDRSSGYEISRVPQARFSDSGGVSQSGMVTQRDFGSQRDISQRDAGMAGRDVMPRAGSPDARAAYVPQPLTGRDVGAPDSATNARLKMAEESLTEPSPRQAEFPSAQAINSDSVSDCVQAEGEFRTALRSEEAPEQLFHLRRALRLCPERAEFHNALGEVYVKLSRDSDATFEFGEALRIEPSNTTARANLQELQAKSTGAVDQLAAQRY